MSSTILTRCLVLSTGVLVCNQKRVEIQDIQAFALAIGPQLRFADRHALSFLATLLAALSPHVQAEDGFKRPALVAGQSAHYFSLSVLEEHSIAYEVLRCELGGLLRERGVLNLANVDEIKFASYKAKASMDVADSRSGKRRRRPSWKNLRTCHLNQ